MKLIDWSVQEFIRDLDSPKPAPGGGSSSAVAAAMGIGLARMVGHLTIPKKKFKRLDESIQDEVVGIHERIREQEKRLLELVDEDTQAFNAIMSAFKMPKDTEKQQRERKEAIQKATYRAAEVPLEIASLAHEVLTSITPLLEHGNKHAISDIGVGALMLYSGLEGAALNVRINLASLDDASYREELEGRLSRYLEEGRSHRDSILEKVNEEIG